MRNFMPDSNALRFAEELIKSQLHTLDDLPKELANTIANIYYEYSFILLELSEMKERGGMIPKSLNEKIKLGGNPQELFKRYMEREAQIISNVEAAPDFIQSLRAIDKMQKTALYQYSVEFLIDCLKYNIKNATQKSELQRKYERDSIAVDEISDLINLMQVYDKKRSYDTSNNNLTEMNNLDSVLSLASPLIVVISRDEIEMMDTSSTLKTLKKLFQSPYRARGIVSLSIHGYDNDPRELFEIEDVRTFIKELDRQFPYWYYFVNKNDETLLLITMCLCRISTVSPGATVINPEDLGLFMENHFSALNDMFDDLQLSENLNEEVSEEIVSYYEKKRILN